MALGKTENNGNELEQQTWPKSESVIASRSGDVLIKSTLLKADHFPGCQNTKLTPLLDGAPNFRQVEGLPVYGVAIPTVRGLRNVLEELGAAQGRRRVLWHNMREEPVLYINGKPYVVREADQPFCNVEYTGIDRSRVEDMEQRLKRDVLREAQRYDNYIMVTEEDDDMNVIDAWEPVTENDVQTPLEVYAELLEDGYDVDYMRVPITDEKAPKDSDFELLIQRLWNVPLDAAMVFNCQMGRGRTTTGMVIATLLTLRRLGAFPGLTHPAAEMQQQQHAITAATERIREQQRSGGAVTVAANGGMFLQLSGQQQHGTAASAAGSQLTAVPAWFLKVKAARGSSSGGAGPGSPSTPRTPLTGEAKLRAGMYGVIRSLLRVLERGVMGKLILDSVVDACSAMQNLREAITTYRGRLMAESKESRRATLMGVCLEYLERYYMLLAFTSYLMWPKFNPASPGHVTFQDWMETRPELRSVLSRMLRRNPLAALDLHIPAATLGSSPAMQQQDDDAHAAAMSQAEARADHIIEARSGAVLGALTILKEDYFPGMKSSRLPQLLPGAGNFRRMAGLPVYGVAMCTTLGIKNVLQAVMKQQTGAGKEVLWFNMREEPVVYINGLPFVLREQQRPMKNLQEYAGIDTERLERMERRLKQDVLAEAAQHNNHILVARESAVAPGASAADVAAGTGEVIDMWERITSADDVQTPAEVYAQLRAEGLPVRYLRVPVTDGTAPQPGDIDAITRQAREVGFECPMVFNCQMGAGRTTTGTVIGGLLAMYGSTVPVRAISTDELAAVTSADAAAAAVVTNGDVGVTTPAKALLASAPSSNSFNIDEISQDIIREELAGDSPRHSEDYDRDSPTAFEPSHPPASLRGASVADVWADLSPEEVQEKISLAGGGYVGVRRVVRLLEHGDNAKRVVDAAIDANAQMVNLRVSIMRYRRPKHQYHNHKSEVSARHSNFRRGSAYLERYCLLIAFGAYLEAEGIHSSVSFADWLDARPELQQALANIHNSPATALAAVPVASVPVLYRSVRGGEEVTPAEQEEVLRKRRGKTLNRRIILKSYLARAADPSLPPGTPDVRQADGLPVFAVGNVSVDALSRLMSHLGAGPGGSCHVVVTDAREELVVYVNGVPYIRRELEMPAAALHHAGVRARQLEALESALKEDVAHEAAKWGGKILLHQEVFTSIDGRRPPSCQMHSAFSGGLPPPFSSSYTGLSITIPGRPGIMTGALPAPLAGSFLTPPVGPVPATAVQLSAAIASPAVAAAVAGVGQVPPSSNWQQQQQRGSGAGLPPLSPVPPVPNGNATAAGSNGFPGFKAMSTSPTAIAAAAAVASPAAAAAPASSPAGGVSRGSSSQAVIGADVTAAASNTRGDCITAPVDVRPGAAVVPFWETVDLSNSGDSSDQQQTSSGQLPLATCLEVAKQLQAAGFHLTYRRIPLSRERTPVPSDLTDMLKQMLALPAGVGPLDRETPGGGASPKAAAMMVEAAEALATSTHWAAGVGHSSSPQKTEGSGELQEKQPPRSIVHLVVSRTAVGSSARFATAAVATFLAKHTRQESQAAASHLPRSPSSSPQGPAAKRMRRTHSDMGEYRGIMSLVRLLPGGSEVKAQVDEAIDRCSAVGNLRDDIKACKHSAEAAPGQSEDPFSTAWAARQLGVHYLKRYFLLIAFRCYLVQRQRANQLGRPIVDFTHWVDDRRELGHLLNHINLDT